VNAREVGFYAMDPDIGQGCPAEVSAAAWEDVTASADIKQMVVVDQSLKRAEIQVRTDGRPRKGSAFCLSFLTILTGIVL
jgi:hypothetical protein